MPLLILQNGTVVEHGNERDFEDSWLKDCIVSKACKIRLCRIKSLDFYHAYCKEIFKKKKQKKNPPITELAKYEKFKNSKRFTSICLNTAPRDFSGPLTAKTSNTSAN
jgi:hypothetical protein